MLVRQLLYTPDYGINVPAVKIKICFMISNETNFPRCVFKICIIFPSLYSDFINIELKIQIYSIKTLGNKSSLVLRSPSLNCHSPNFQTSDYRIIE